MEKIFICCLLCVCFTSLVQGAPTRPTMIYRELIKDIGNLEKMVKMDAEELHSPRNMLDNCLLSAFKCFVNESSALKPKDNQNEDHFNTLLSRIKFSPQNVNLNISDPTCSPCTNYNKRPKAVFLREFILLLRRLNIRAI